MVLGSWLERRQFAGWFCSVPFAAFGAALALWSFRAFYFLLLLSFATCLVDTLLG